MLVDLTSSVTNATYSTGSVFTYTYDAVGNRLTETTITATTVYTYDNANRLTNVGAQAYTWDNNRTDEALNIAFTPPSSPLSSPPPA